jgi:hypothetical protein
MTVTTFEWLYVIFFFHTLLKTVTDFMLHSLSGSSGKNARKDA